MDSSQRKHIAFSFRLLEIIFGMFLMIFFLFGMKDVESSMFPVVENFAVNSVTEIDNGIEIYGTMTKIRDCRFKEMMVYVKKDDEKLPVAADFKFLDPAQNLESRATVSQKWGPWRIFIPDANYSSANIKMYVRHRCHSFYDTTTDLHNFEIQRVNEEIQLIKG